MTGRGTGHDASRDELAQVRAAVTVPVLVVSGVTPQTLEQLLPLASGFIVGSSLKVDGLVSNPVDPARV